MAGTINIKRAVAKALRRKAAVHNAPNFDDFVLQTFPKYEMNWHHQVLCDAIQAWIKKDVPNLIVSMPPRHGKSELCSTRLTPYIFGCNPDALVISCNYSAGLAGKMNRSVQRVIDSPQYKKIFPEIRLGSKGSGYVRTNRELEIDGFSGRYLSTGVGGGIVGEGMDFGIIDDPVKNRKEANSKTYQESTWDWFKDVFRTRLHKDGAIMIVATRWHEEDLIGKLLKSQPGKWYVINLPAVYDENLSVGVTENRTKGDLLWPNRYGKEAIDDLKMTLGTYGFGAQYQGDPFNKEGTILKPSYWQYYDARPEFMEVVQSWDTAFKEGEENDYSVCTTWGVGMMGDYILHRYKEKIAYPQLKEKMVSLAELWRPSHLLIEDKASGQSIIQELQQTTSLPVIPIMPIGDKLSRAHSCTGILDAGRVYLPTKAPWLDDLIEECRKFPHAKHDDTVDSVTQFINWKIARGATTTDISNKWGR